MFACKRFPGNAGIRHTDSDRAQQLSAYCSGENASPQQSA
jgi:hypothetical protein